MVLVIHFLMNYLARFCFRFYPTPGHASFVAASLRHLYTYLCGACILPSATTSLTVYY
jgi:hypothetical protein